MNASALNAIAHCNCGECFRYNTTGTFPGYGSLLHAHEGRHWLLLKCMQILACKAYND